MRDDDKFDDPFKQDVSDEAKKHAEQMLAGSRLATFFEKRNLGDDFRKAWLAAPRDQIGPLQVLLSRKPGGGRDALVVLSETLLPEIGQAEITYHTPMGDKTLFGRVEAGRQGRRVDDDKGDRRISVAWFHPLE